MGNSIQAIHCTNENVITQEKSGIVKLWNIQNETNYEFSKEYQCGGGYCRSIVIDDTVILPQSNSRLDVIELKTLTLLRTFEPSQENLGYVMSLQKVELDNKTFILAGYEAGDVILWDFLEASQCSRLKLHECITSLTFDSVSRRGICGNSSNILQVFTIEKDLNMKLKCEISIANEGCNIVKIRPDRKIFVSGGWDGRLRLFSWKSLRLLVVLKEHRKSVTDVQFSPNIVPVWNSTIMAAAGADGAISLWNLYNN